MTTQPILVGPLEELLQDAAITAIHSDSNGIRYEKGGQTYASSLSFANESQRRTIITAIVAAGGAMLSADHPVVECVLSDGTRVHAEHDPLTLALFKQT